MWQRRTAPGVTLCAILAIAIVAATITTSRSGAAATAPTSKSTSWVGVGELVVVKLDSTGKVTGTPYQHTELTASSSGTVKVQVPMSASGLRSLGRGKPPPVAHSVADFSFEPNGTTTQNVRSDLASALPLTVMPSYELDGKPTTASELEPTRRLLKKKYKSGTLHVTYEIANVSKATTTVAFEGFNGAHVHQTITRPLPIVAEVKLTFPKSATDVAAPNAALATGVSGVGATWTLALAPPLSAAKQSISYSVHLGEVKIPTLTVEAEVLAPKAAPSGKAPAQAAAQLAALEDTSENGLSGPSVSLGGVHADLDRPLRSTSSDLDHQTRTKKSAATHERNARASIGGIQDDVTGLALNQTSATQTTGRSADDQLNNLQGIADQALGDVSDQESATALQVTADLTSALTAMTKSTSNLASNAVADGELLQKHAAVADALKAAIAALATLVDNLVTVVKQHTDDVSALDALLIKLIADADGFTATDKTAPEWIALAGDLAIARTKADLINTAAADITQRVEAVAGAVHDLQRRVADLDADAHQDATHAEQFTQALTADLTAKQHALQDSIAGVSGRVAGLDAQLATDRADLATATSDGRATLGDAEQVAGAKVAGAEAKAKASVQQAVGNAQADLNKANDDYAQLVAVSQIALAHQLPGGNATGANVQNGAWVYRIPGTG
jgi:hypothetical protein